MRKWNWYKVGSFIVMTLLGLAVQYLFGLMVGVKQAQMELDGEVAVVETEMHYLRQDMRAMQQAMAEVQP